MRAAGGALAEARPFRQKSVMLKLFVALTAASLAAVAADAAPPPPFAQSGGGSARATPQAIGPERVFTPRDAFALQQATDVQISPDGRQVAYVRSSEDIMTDSARRSVWLVDVASGAQRPLLTGGASSPRWSPDGARIAYVAAEAGERPQLFVRWLATGASARIADLPDAPRSLSWSPDGRFIAFTMFVPEEGATLGAPLRKPEGARWAEPPKLITAVHFREDGEGDLRPGYAHLFVVSADGGAPRQLTFGPYDDGGEPSWTPDGRYLLFSSNHGKDWERDPLNSEVFQARVTDGELTQLTRRQGPDAEPVASPDGRLIAYTGFDDRLRGYENVRLYVMNRDGTNPRLVSGGLDRSVARPRWSADGRGLYASYVDRGVTKVARFGLDGRMADVARGAAGAEMDRPYSGGGFSLSHTGVVAFPFGEADHPAEVAVAGRDGTARRLTRLNDDLFAGKALAQVRALPVTSSADGLKVDAWLMTPPNHDPQRRYPTILEIHGGPFASYGPLWSTEDQLYAAAGYAVVYANPRGSTSYGEAFANQIDRNYPSHDYDDLMSAVDAAVAAGVADPDRLFVTGGSGGGLLTAWITGKTDRFKAAASQKPVINWSSEVLTVDGYTFMAKYWFGKMPWEDPQHYWARSPLSLVGSMKTPTLVVVGSEDRRTPDSEAEQLYAALQLRSVPTGLLRVPGASHEGLAERPSQLAAENAAILAWFARYDPAAARPPTRP